MRTIQLRKRVDDRRKCLEVYLCCQHRMPSALGITGSGSAAMRVHPTVHIHQGRPLLPTRSLGSLQKSCANEGLRECLQAFLKLRFFGKGYCLVLFGNYFSLFVVVVRRRSSYRPLAFSRQFDRQLIFHS